MEKLFQLNGHLHFLAFVLAVSFVILSFYGKQWRRYFYFKKYIEINNITEIDFHEMTKKYPHGVYPFVAKKTAKLIAIRILDLFYTQVSPSIIFEILAHKIGIERVFPRTNEEINNHLQDILIKEMSERNNRRFLDIYRQAITEKGEAEKLQELKLIFLKKVRNKSNTQEFDYSFKSESD